MAIVAQPRAQTYVDPVPVINSFTANPSYIQQGQTAVLTWTVSDALGRNVDVTISPAIGSVPSSGSYSVTPSETTTYTLIATNEDGSVSASTTVTVAPYVTTFNTSSGSEMAITGSIADLGDYGILTSGVAGDNEPVNSWMLYILLIGLLAVAAVVAIAFLVRKPAVAYSGNRAGTRVGYLSSATDTRVADETTCTTPAIGLGPKLIALDGGHVSISGKAGSLGRSDFRSLVKPDIADLISREHIRFDCEDGECFIEDSNSTNGTKINGSRISGEGRFLLRDGDVVEVAGVLTLTFKV